MRRSESFGRDPTFVDPELDEACFYPVRAFEADGVVVVVAAVRVAMPFEDDGDVVVFDHRGGEHPDPALVGGVLRGPLEARHDRRYARTGRDGRRDAPALRRSLKAYCA